MAFSHSRNGLSGFIVNEVPAPSSFEITQELAAFDLQQAENPPTPPAPEDSANLTATPTGVGVFNEGTYPANPVFESFSNAMQDYGIQTELLADARSWLDTLADLGDLTGQRIEHGYDVKGYLDSFEPQDQQILTHFLNHAARSGWTQEDVGAAIQWYLDAFSDTGQSHEGFREALQAERDIEALDRQDRDQARGKLKEIWSEEYDANIHLANRHLDSLPASQREFYEGAESNGSLRLNNPKWLDRLAQEARAQVPPILIEAAHQHGSEWAALESMMANKGSEYWKGENAAALQARYRDLISSGDNGEKPLPSGSGIAAEISAIEHVMKTERHRYFRDEALQQRYRDLLELRD